MPEITPLEDVLNEKPPVVEQVETKVEGAPVLRSDQSLRKAHRDKEQEAQGRVRDPETGQYRAKEDVKEVKDPKPEAKVEVKEKTEVKQDLSEKEKAFLKGMQEERSKRQELERRLAALEESKPKEPEKKFYDDPDGALAKLQAERQKEKEEIKSWLASSRIATAEMIARQRHPDFEQKVVGTFEELLKNTPGLYQQWITAPDPAEFAYTACKNHIEIKEAGSIDELRARMEKEIRLKIESELKEKAESLAKEKAAIPPSLSDAKSVGSTNRPVWNGPTSFDNILK